MGIGFRCGHFGRRKVTIRLVRRFIGGLNPATIGIMVARLDGYRSVKLKQVDLS